MGKLKLALGAAGLLAGLSVSGAYAGAVAYPNVGTINPIDYTFTAQYDGDVYATFAG